MRKTLLVLGTVAILLAVMFCVESVAQAQSPQREQGENGNRERIFAIAIKPDTPRVSLHGNVYMPDGSHVREWETPVLFLVPVQRDDDYEMVGSISGGREIRMLAPRRDGTVDDTNVPSFQIINDTRGPFIGSNVVVMARSGDGQFVSKPLVFVARENMEPLHITLEKGVPVRGKIMYENDTPAAERVLIFEQHFEPIVGNDIQEIRDMFRYPFVVRSNETGEYEIFLSPGKYGIYGLDADHRSNRERTYTLTVKETDTEKRLDWTMPTPIFIETVLADGSPTRSQRYVYANKESPREIQPQTNTFLLDVTNYNGTLYIYDTVSNQGAIETITPAMVGTRQQFKLQPMGNVLVKIVDADGVPVRQRGMRLRILTDTPAGSMLIVSRATTDTNGIAILHVPAGKMRVALRLNNNPDREFVNQNEIEIDLNLASYETLFFGVIRLTNEGQLPPQ